MAEDGEAGVGFPPSPWVGTNGFAEDVKPFPTGLPSHLDVASDITGLHTAIMTYIFCSKGKGWRASRPVH